MGGALSAEYRHHTYPQTFRVPPGVTLLEVIVIGAGAQGLQTLLDVVAGEVFYARVGAAPTGAAGGWPDGGDGNVVPLPEGSEHFGPGTSAGFGSSEVRRGTDTEADRVLMAPGRAGITYGYGPDGTLFAGGSIAGTGELDERNGYVILDHLPDVDEVPRRIRGFDDPDSLPDDWDPAWFDDGGLAEVGGEHKGGAGWESSVALTGDDLGGPGEVIIICGAGGGGMGGGSSGHLFLRNDAGPAGAPDYVPPYIISGPNNGGWYAKPGLPHAVNSAGFTSSYSGDGGLNGEGDGFVRFGWGYEGPGSGAWSSRGRVRF